MEIKTCPKCDKITFGILAERRDIFDCNADQCGASAVPSLDKGKLAPNDCTIFHRVAFAQPHLEKSVRENGKQDILNKKQKKNYTK